MKVLSSRLDDQLKELENNEDFMHAAKLVAGIIRRDNGTIPTPRQLDKDPDLNMKRLKEVVGAKRAGGLWDLLVAEARKQLSNGPTASVKKPLGQQRKQQQERWLETLVDIVEKHNGDFPTFKVLSSQPNVRYSELLDVFGSYDVIRVATMTAYNKKHSKTLLREKEAISELAAMKKTNKANLEPKAIEKDEAVSESKTTKENDEHGRRYTTESIKEILVKYYEEHGKLPSQSECRRDSYIPSWGTLTKHLGPCKNWARKIGIEAEVPEPKTKSEVKVEKPEPKTKSEVKVEKLEPKVKSEVKVEEPKPKVEIKADKQEPEVESKVSKIEAKRSERVMTAEQNVDDGLEVQVTVKLPGQEKPLKITISQ